MNRFESELEVSGLLSCEIVQFPIDRDEGETFSFYTFVRHEVLHKHLPVYPFIGLDHGPKSDCDEKRHKASRG